ncbi:hypothetical protein A4X13_0g5324 [Tilletia indica]|uniref:Uncharacterized protein n=1 Tax=Tilletia indica TaxID=43049 RepID=A0A177T6Q6_9BASI|nr:hypothetical protein A4X13_0g5324 [Tilletia indica]
MQSVLPDNDHYDAAIHEVSRQPAQSHAPIAHDAFSHSFNAVNGAGDAADDDDDDDGEDDDMDMPDGDGDASVDRMYADGNGDVDMSMLSQPGMSGRRGRGKYLKPKPLDQVLTRVITALIRRDTYAFFTDPVNPEEVPGYRDVIKEPLDFGTIRERVEAEEYTNVASFTDDVNLVFRNAKTFNPPDTIYHSEADRIETWFRKKMILEGPSAILPDLATLKARSKARARASTAASASTAFQVKHEDEDDEDDDDNDYDSANDDRTKRGSASAAGGSQRGGRTASPEANRPAQKKRKLNASSDGPPTSSLAALLSSSGGFVGLPGPNTPFAKALAAISVTQARWRLASAAASQCAHREAQFSIRKDSEPNLLRRTISSQAAISNAAVAELQDESPKGPLPTPQIAAGDDSVPSVNPLQGLRRMQYHSDGSLKIPGFTTPAQGWPDTSEAFAMNLLPTSDNLYMQLGLQLPPPRIRALFPMLPLPAPPDAVTTANGKALPVPLTVGGTSALNAGANLASASFTAAQQTPWTSSGNPFPSVRNESAVLQSAGTAAALLPHPVPIGATYSHEVSMQTTGGQTAFGPGQGADGGPWTISSGGPEHDPESSVLAAASRIIQASSEATTGVGWWDGQVRKRAVVPPHWGLPDMVPYSTGVGGHMTHASGTASPSSPSTPARMLPTTPMGPAFSINRGSPSPAPGVTQPSTPVGSAQNNLHTSAAHGWAQRASKGRERERERESDLRDWTITRPILERGMTFEDIGVVWGEIRSRMATTVRSMYLQTIDDARSQVLALTRELTESQSTGRRGDAQQVLARIQAQRSFIDETNRLLAQTGRVEDGVGAGRNLGRYDFVEGEQLHKTLEYALEREPAQRIWEAAALRGTATASETLKAAIEAKDEIILPTSVGARVELGFASEQDIQEDFSFVQQRVWGGPLGEAYASSMARFINGAKRSVDDWADFSTGVEGVEDDEVEEALAAENGEGDLVGEEDELRPLRKREYRDEEYIGGGLRVLLVPPADELAEEMNAGEDHGGEETSRHKPSPIMVEDYPRKGDPVSPSRRLGIVSTTTAQDGEVKASASAQDGGRDGLGRRQRRWPAIRKDTRALDDIVRDDVLDPLTGGMLSVLHLAGTTARETMELLTASTSSNSLAAAVDEAAAAMV